MSGQELMRKSAGELASTEKREILSITFWDYLVKKNNLSQASELLGASRRRCNDCKPNAITI